MELLVTSNRPLKTSYHNRDGKDYMFEYYDIDSFDNLSLDKVKQVYGVCFYQDKMVIVFNGNAKTWGLAGGTREGEETIEQTLKREIIEESNMEVITWKPIGVQKVTSPEKEISYQLRTVCQVKPLGEFISDPGGSISEIKLVNPKEYKQYFDWGKIGERIIQRALELKSSLE